MKKKGLIISTIVMVVVLIASLTTATYAWFSSDAQAKVENISIMTVTNTGLQVAVEKASETYISGDISYAESQFTGTVDDWGTVVNFQPISTTLGSISNAVTRVTSENVASFANLVFAPTTVASGDYATAVASGLYYKKTTGSTVAMTQITDEVWSDEIAYYTKASNPSAGDYLSPIGYNTLAGVLTPYAYTVANRNGTNGYLDLPIAVRATDTMKAVLCTMTITPKKGTASNSTWNNYKPGMAAAIRVRISDGTHTVEVEPYYNVVKSGSAFNNKTETAFALDFVVAYGEGGAATVAALDALKLTYTIWIEGEDNQCIDIVTGTGAQVDLAYSFIATDNTTAVWTNVATAADITSASVKYSGDKVSSHETAGYIEFSTKNYYIFSFSKQYPAA